MADRNQLEQTLRETYAARRRGDVEGILRHFSPDARFTMAGSPETSPVAMRVEGHAPFREALQGMVKTFVVEDLDVVSMVIEGDRAAVHWRATFRSAVTGDILKSDLCDFVEFKDGRIATFHEFCDTAAAARLMGRA
jgi:ketosteroid isomerase-like protein